MKPLVTITPLEPRFRGTTFGVADPYLTRRLEVPRMIGGGKWQFYTAGAFAADADGYPTLRWFAVPQGFVPHDGLSGRRVDRIIVDDHFA